MNVLKKFTVKINFFKILVAKHLPCIETTRYWINRKQKLSTELISERKNSKSFSLFLMMLNIARPSDVTFLAQSAVSNF